MECSENLARLSLCGVLFAVSACGGEMSEREQPPAGQSDTARPEAADQGMRARATIAGPPGSGIEGEVTFVELSGNEPVPGVRIEVRITGPVDRLTPGPHGLHIHETGQGGCVPPYEAAEGHFDPGPSGNSDPDVNHPFHLGDIPNLVVDQNGAGRLDAITSRITLSSGPLSVFDGNGSAIILHEKADQGISGPSKSGVSGGGRIACGVIERSGE